MTLNTSQVSYYMTQRKKGITQHISAMKAGISVRSGRRIEKGEWAKNSVRHWRTRKDPLEAVWDSMLVPLLKERPALTPTTLLEMLQDKYPGQYPNSLRRTMQRRVREPDMAGRLMVHALKLAAGYDDISVVAKGMEQMLNTPGNVDLHRLMRFLGIKEKALPVVNVKQHNLSSYEQLLRGKGGSQ
ncbi:hypothetical protein HV305_09185 [Escherichia coli]|nr:hypothetical protein HV305_09185 [Escherichia coli]